MQKLNLQAGSATRLVIFQSTMKKWLSITNGYKWINLSPHIQKQVHGQAEHHRNKVGNLFTTKNLAFLFKKQKLL